MVQLKKIKNSEMYKSNDRRVAGDQFAMDTLSRLRSFDDDQLQSAYDDAIKIIHKDIKQRHTWYRPYNLFGLLALIGSCIGLLAFLNFLIVDNFTRVFLVIGGGGGLYAYYRYECSQQDLVEICRVTKDVIQMIKAERGSWVS